MWRPPDWPAATNGECATSSGSSQPISLRFEGLELHADGRLAAFRERTALKQRSSSEGEGPARGKGQPDPGAESNGERKKRSPVVSAPRSLVDPRSLTLVDPKGSMEDGTPRSAGGTQRRSGRGGLNKPRRGSAVPRNKTALRGYSDLDKEEMGLDLFKKLLASDEEQITDLRRQRGVGADAMDELQYYELKVSAGAEPDEVTLTASEVERARTSPKFLLVVVSDVEGVDARPRLRVIADPLNTLQTTERGSITFSGVRTARSLVYHFGSPDDQPGIGEDEE